MNPSSLPHLPLLPTSSVNSCWSGLAGAGLSLACLQAAEQHSGPTVVACADQRQLQALRRETAVFNHNNFPILTFPDWEILPYDHFSPHPDLVSARLRTLAAVRTGQPCLIILAMPTAMLRLPPVKYFERAVFFLAEGEQCDMHATAQRLADLGYQSVSHVVTPGEFCIRGALFDLFPMGADQPYRIDLFDNTVDSIRAFDNETQRSGAAVGAIEVLPAHEYPLTPTAIEQFRQTWRARFSGNPQDCPHYLNVSKGHASGGIEYYLPLFFNQLTHLFDYLPDQAQLLFAAEDLPARCDQFWQQLQQRFEQYGGDRTRPLLPPNEVALPTAELFALCKRFPITTLSQAQTPPLHSHDMGIRPLPDLRLTPRSQTPCTALLDYIHTCKQPIVFCAESAGREAALMALLKPHNIRPTACANWAEVLACTERIMIIVAALDAGCQIEPWQRILITEHDLFGDQVLQRRARKRQVKSFEQAIHHLSELAIDDPVVHADHGVGRYAGLTTITTHDIPSEYLTLRYADEATLYVPVTALALVSRYTGSETAAPLDKLGAKRWQKLKKKAEKAVQDTAAELLALYALRASKAGDAFATPEPEYTHFCTGFPYEPTPDQADAITAVLEDLKQPKPMDRLICGDVGFGKTEVALRAAFVVAYHHRQVAILVPTTLLAQQHLEQFQARFANWPIKVALLSRFLSMKVQQETLAGLASGQIDIVIGTHKLLQKSVRFHALGLLIVDEEHRFGVKQKEKIKALSASVDLLTLTATPIPRTLNLALNTLRDLSIISTPPQTRLPVKTFVHRFDKALVREAILRECTRGGQVFFLHNEVKSLAAMADQLRRWVPEALIETAHGQMAEHDLEMIMRRFYHGRFNVLVSSTIIESGIDIPTANTILINRADRLGLSQLHQLRGRVGRAHQQAYAYMLTPESGDLTRDAQKRLEAIASMQDLGAGFMLATQDLEIRGAGELLGAQQSGQIHGLGFGLYMTLLDQAIKALRAGEISSTGTALAESLDINWPWPTLIPEHYVGDVCQRLTLYKRIASAMDEAELAALQEELIDRFGPLPDATMGLFAVTQLKQQATPLGMTRIDVNNKRAVLNFATHSRLDTALLMNLIAAHPKQYQLVSPTAFALYTEPDYGSETEPDAEQWLTALLHCLDALTRKTTDSTA